MRDGHGEPSSATSVSNTTWLRRARLTGTRRRPARRRLEVIEGDVQAELVDQQVIDVERARRTVGLPARRGEECPRRWIAVVRPRDRGVEAVGAPSGHGRRQEPAAVAATTPARLHEQVGDRRRRLGQRLLLRSERRLVGRAGRDEAHHVRPHGRFASAWRVRRSGSSGGGPACSIAIMM